MLRTSCWITGSPVDRTATAFIKGNYAGGAAFHWFASFGGRILVISGPTVTLSGAPAFTIAFSYAEGLGAIRATGMTFSGSATGKRYELSGGSLVQTFGGASYLPGDVAGTTATGGQFL